MAWENWRWRITDVPRKYVPKFQCERAEGAESQIPRKYVPKFRRGIECWRCIITNFEVCSKVSAWDSWGCILTRITSSLIYIINHRLETCQLIFLLYDQVDWIWRFNRELIFGTIRIRIMLQTICLYALKTFFFFHEEDHLFCWIGYSSFQITYVKCFFDT